MLRRLNLGCGPNWKEYGDYEGLDIKDFGQKWVIDVIPFLLDSKRFEKYDEIMANHFLEHFTQDQLVVIFKGISNVLKKKGVFKFVVPHKDKDKAWALTHKTFWNECAVASIEEIPAFGSWEITELITNERKDIHVQLRKK